MALVKTPNTVAGTQWIHLTGTILEVLNALGAENASAENMVHWEDDNTDAKALMCRQH